MVDKAGSPAEHAPPTTERGDPPKTPAPTTTAPATETPEHRADRAAHKGAAQSETTSETVSRVVEDWFYRIRTGRNPISRLEGGNNFLAEQLPALKAALTREL